MTFGRSSEPQGPPPCAGIAERPACPRCGSYLRAGHAPDAANPYGLCDPCLALVRSCAPFAGARPTEQTPPDVNLLELVAGIMLTHDALHPGEPLYLREALAAHGVDVDHAKIWQTVGKLRRRHGLVVSGEPREPGHRVTDWTWEARRARSSVSSRTPVRRDVAASD
jgi:hypothetical protein